MGMPSSWLSRSTSFSLSDLGELSVLALLFIAWLAPFDFLGGYRLPKRFLKSEESFSTWLIRYFRAAIGQSFLFIVFACLILVFGRWFGMRGAITMVVLGITFCFVLQNQAMRFRRVESHSGSNKLLDSLTLIQSWQIFVPNIIVVRHRDIGFTGGIIGFGNGATIVIPQAWLETMSQAELATVIARRAIAFNSGSYYRGLAFAGVWNLIGFIVCTQLPNAGVDSVARAREYDLWFHAVVVSRSLDASYSEPQCVSSNRSLSQPAWDAEGANSQRSGFVRSDARR